MGQITAETIKMIDACYERKERPPLTIWEIKQLAHAWTELESLRTSRNESERANGRNQG
jgi:hypothetical protein